MSDGRWSGGTNNRTWARPGSRVRDDKLPAAARREAEERSARLAALMADVPFLDETCGRMHPLSEHAACRKA